MGLGILEPLQSDHVPGMLCWQHYYDDADCSAGTSFVYDDASRPGEDGQLDSRLKYDRTGPVPIILVPQPSDDPNDPLVMRFPIVHDSY